MTIATSWEESVCSIQSAEALGSIARQELPAFQIPKRATATQAEGERTTAACQPPETPVFFKCKANFSDIASSSA